MQTKVDRKESKRWVAPQTSYDGEDWGDEYDDNEGLGELAEEPDSQIESQPEPSLNQDHQVPPHQDEEPEPEQSESTNKTEISEEHGFNEESNGPPTPKQRPHLRVSADSTELNQSDLQDIYGFYEEQRPGSHPYSMLSQGSAPAEYSDSTASLSTGGRSIENRSSLDYQSELVKVPEESPTTPQEQRQLEQQIMGSFTQTPRPDTQRPASEVHDPELAVLYQGTSEFLERPISVYQGHVEPLQMKHDISDASIRELLTPRLPQTEVSPTSSPGPEQGSEHDPENEPEPGNEQDKEHLHEQNRERLGFAIPSSQPPSSPHSKELEPESDQEHLDHHEVPGLQITEASPVRGSRGLADSDEDIEHAEAKPRFQPEPLKLPSERRSEAIGSPESVTPSRRHSDASSTRVSLKDSSPKTSASPNSSSGSAGDDGNGSEVDRSSDDSYKHQRKTSDLSGVSGSGVSGVSGMSGLSLNDNDDIRLDSPVVGMNKDVDSPMPSSTTEVTSPSGQIEGTPKSNIAAKVKRPPAVDLSALFKNPSGSSESRYEQLRALRLREAQYSSGLETWLAAIYSTADPSMAVYTTGKPPPPTHPPDESAASKVSSAMHTAISHTKTKEKLGRVGEKSKIFFAKGRKLMRSGES